MCSRRLPYLRCRAHRIKHKKVFLTDVILITQVLKPCLNLVNTQHTGTRLRTRKDRLSVCTKGIPNMRTARP